jgi:hypothetical protein
MNAKIRRRIEMGSRALEFSRARPDASPGYNAAVARLEELLLRADRLATQQREGRIQVHAAALRKQELRRMMRLAHFPHLARVAEGAAQDEPELATKFVLTRAARPYLAFRTAARSIFAEAQARKELMEKHGLAESVLESLAQSLNQFDEAMEQVTEGRRAHVGARAELEHVAGEVVRMVNLMDGFNRLRFATDAESLAAWASASKVLAPSPPKNVEPAPDERPRAGEIRPAA